MGIPRDIMAEKFREGTVGLDRAIQNGSVVQWSNNGVLFCAYQQIEVGHQRALEVRDTLLTGKSLTKEQAKEIEAAVSNAQFSLNFNQKETKAIANDGAVPEKAYGKLSEALVLAEKAEKEGEKFWDKLSNEPNNVALNAMKEQLEKALTAVSADRRAADNRHLLLLLRSPPPPPIALLSDE